MKIYTKMYKVKVEKVDTNVSTFYINTKTNLYNVDNNCMLKDSHKIHMINVDKLVIVQYN